MAQKTQGTELYAIDPADDSLIVVGCFTGVDVDQGANDELDTTCMPNTAGRTSLPGLPGDGQVSFELNWDPSDASHVRLNELFQAGTTFKVAVGESDGTGIDPTVDSNGDFSLPSTRSWVNFQGYVTAFPWNRALNSITKSPVTFRISGAATQTSKA